MRQRLWCWVLGVLLWSGLYRNDRLWFWAVARAGAAVPYDEVPESVDPPF